MLRRESVIALLGVMAMGATLAALEHSLAVTMIGAVLIGSVLAPLGANYALALDGLAPPVVGRRHLLFYGPRMQSESLSPARS